MTNTYIVYCVYLYNVRVNRLTLLTIHYAIGILGSSKSKMERKLLLVEYMILLHIIIMITYRN